MNLIKNKSFIIPFVEIFAKVISFCNVLLLVRILTIEEYADYSYIVAIVLWSSVLMDGGINSLIYNKSLKKDIKGINELYTGRFFLSMFIISFIALFFIGTNPILTIAAIVFSFSAYYSSTSALIKMLSRGMEMIKVDFISIISEPMFRLCFLLIIYFSSEFFEYNLRIVLSIYLFAGIIAFSINNYYLSFKIPLKLEIDRIKSIYESIIFSLNQSKYYLFYYLMLVGLGRIDVIFIEAFTTKNDLAIFSSALNIYSVAQLFFISVITSQFIKLHNNERLIFKILIPLLCVTIIFVNLFSGTLFSYLFPKEYIDGHKVLNILILSILPSIINFYYITKNNYEENVRLNFILLSVVFSIKCIIYLIFKSTDIIVYSYCFFIAELLMLLLIILRVFYENITNK